VSGPVTTEDTAPAGGAPVATAAAPSVELVEGRRTSVGGVPVTRLLPKRTRRTVGAWCFIDHMGPVDATAADPQIGPHPHIGLQTVTWILEGELLHRDSIGSEQLIRPGQLNLMSAGRGVVHAEESPGGRTGRVHGVQLWVAQPEATRHGVPLEERLVMWWNFVARSHEEVDAARLDWVAGAERFGDVHSRLGRIEAPERRRGG
jgi:redox-sensitive bicupin YhaK (pirin superfamily)